MKNKFKQFYLNVARETAKLSYARRLKVGSVIIKNNRIISIGYNGSPAGWDNNCEEELFSYDERGTYFEREEWEYDKKTKQYFRLKTKPEVLYSEQNALYKLASSHESGLGASMFCTHSPCIECSKGIYMSGIIEFYYGEEYRDSGGLDFLKKCGVRVEKI